MLSEIYVFISQVNHKKKKKKVLPILYCLFISSQNNRRLHLCRESWCWVVYKVDRISYTRKRMRNATSALVDRDFASIISNKTRHYKMAARAVHNKKTHDIRNGEDTKRTLQILCLCAIKHVVFNVYIPNTWLQNNEKFLVCSEKYNQFDIYQPSCVSLLEPWWSSQWLKVIYFFY